MRLFLENATPEISVRDVLKPRSNVHDHNEIDIRLIRKWHETPIIVGGGATNAQTSYNQTYDIDLITTTTASNPILRCVANGQIVTPEYQQAVQPSIPQAYYYVVFPIQQTASGVEISYPRIQIYPFEALTDVQINVISGNRLEIASMRRETITWSI